LPGRTDGFIEKAGGNWWIRAGVLWAGSVAELVLQRSCAILIHTINDSEIIQLWLAPGNVKG
jgi:hypothetical protein